MSGLSVVLRGLDAPLRGLKQSGRIIQEEVEKGAERVIQSVRTDLSDYPAERPGQRYVRTGTLGKGWRSAPLRYVSRGSSIGVSLTNPTSYATYVQDQPTQAWMHKGRWPTVQEVLDEAGTELTREMEAAIERAAERMVQG